jgi:cytochrome P450
MDAVETIDMRGLRADIRDVREPGGVLDTLRQIAADQGDLARLDLPGSAPVLVVSSPAGFEHVLARNGRNYTKQTHMNAVLRSIGGDGLFTIVQAAAGWREERSHWQPSFTRASLARVVERVARVALEARTGWEQRVDEGRPVELTELSDELSSEMILRALLDTGLDRELRAGILRFFAGYREFVNGHLRNAWGLPEPYSAARADRLRQAREQANHALEELCTRLIRDKLAQGLSGEDLLSRLLVGRDPDTPDVRRRIRWQLSTVLVAGSEAVSAVWCWACALLARHPHALATMQAELDAVVGDHGLTLETIGKLAYTESVAREALRLYPPAWAIDRRCVADDELLGARVPAGSIVLVSPYLLHRRPDLWCDPEEFDPARWQHGPPPGGFAPFGFGSRRCLGDRLGLLELTIALAVFWQRLGIELPPGRTIAPDVVISLRPRAGELSVRLVRREPVEARGRAEQRRGHR